MMKGWDLFLLNGKGTVIQTMGLNATGNLISF
jgi:hypothetical protein